MDWMTLQGIAGSFFKKYKYVLFVLLLGIVFMLIPSRDSPEETPLVESRAEDMPGVQEELASILSKIEGAGRVELLLTCAAGEEVLYQTDLDLSQTDDGLDETRKTVIITDSGRVQTAVIRQVLPPVYLGAVVVCQGGDSPTVRLAMVEAVSKATGLSADKITVLKMK